MRTSNITRTDFSDWYEVYIIKNAIQFAKKHSDVEGVNRYLEILQKKREDYDGEIKEYIIEQQPIADELFNKLNRMVQYKRICKWAIAPALVLTYVSNTISRANMSSGLISDLFWWVCILSIIGFIVFKILGGRLNRSYNELIQSIRSGAYAINRKYLSDVPKIQENIDDLYLKTLDPAHREIVLMRREQEQRHQESRQAEMQHRRVMEEEQKRTRKAQEEMLQIEKEREKRYWDNRR